METRWEGKTEELTSFIMRLCLPLFSHEPLPTPYTIEDLSLKMMICILQELQTMSWLVVRFLGKLAFDPQSLPRFTVWEREALLRRLLGRFQRPSCTRRW